MNTTTETYQGYEIEINQDDSPTNPFTAYDCEMPIWTYYENMTGFNEPPSLADLIARLPDKLVRDQWQDITLTIVDHHIPVAAVKEYISNQTEEPEEFEDFLKDALTELCFKEPSWGQWHYAEQYLDAMTHILDLLGWKYYYGTSTGYSQGDSAHVLAIATPEWYKLAGAPFETHERQAKATFDLYTAWAWGDCYWYSIPELDETLSGFYGTDHEKSGLLSEARGSIDHHIEVTGKAKRDMLKKLIANHVPFEKRSEILERVTA